MVVSPAISACLHICLWLDRVANFVRVQAVLIVYLELALVNMFFSDYYNENKSMLLIVLKCIVVVVVEFVYNCTRA
jgi:hypothetical protein